MIIQTIDFGFVAIIIFLGAVFITVAGKDAINWFKRVFRGLLSRKGKNDKGNGTRIKKKMLHKSRGTK